MTSAARREPDGAQVSETEASVRDRLTQRLPDAPLRRFAQECELECVGAIIRLESLCDRVTRKRNDIVGAMVDQLDGHLDSIRRLIASVECAAARWAALAGDDAEAP